MPKKKPSKDVNAHAFNIVQQATQEEPENSSAPSGAELISKVMREMGRKGGMKGGKARAKALTPEQRAEIARKAATKRWGNKK